LLATTAAVFGVFLLLSFLIVRYSLQTRMLFPGADTQGTDEARFTPPPGAELVTLQTNGGDRVVALFCPARTADGTIDPDAARRPTLMYFYGNGMCLRDAVDHTLDRFAKLGVNLLLPDYVGYGLSGGDPGEAGCYATADACYEHLLTRRDIDPSRIVAVGRSLGGAVAIDLASRRKLAGVVAFSTFSRMKDMVHRFSPLIPTTLLLRHKFDSQDKIKRVTCPILLGHGRVDSMVPCEMSETLAAAATAPVTRLVVEDADHNDLFEIGEAQILAALRSFLANLPASR
jgi:pimeloyl-ACP methyl ester carboxylesterase